MRRDLSSTLVTYQNCIPGEDGIIEMKGGNGPGVGDGKN